MEAGLGYREAFILGLAISGPLGEVPRKSGIAGVLDIGARGVGLTLRANVVKRKDEMSREVGRPSRTNP
jgi:hypothetical protein